MNENARAAIADALDAHLNDGCVESDCYFDIDPEEQQAHFSSKFINHLVNSIVESLDELEAS